MATQSDVFEKLLLGEFKESTNHIVPIDEEGDVLKAVVEYCHTGTVEMLKKWKMATAEEEVESHMSLSIRLSLFSATRPGKAGYGWAS